MPDVRRIQLTFNAGEWSPRASTRSDLVKYLNALETCENWLLFRTGAATRRPGLRYAAETKDSAASTDRQARMIRFQFNVTQVYFLEFGHLYIRFYRDNGVILSGSTPYEIASPWSSTDLDDLQIEQVGDTMHITHPDYAPRDLTRADHDDWTLASTVFDPEATVEEDLDLATEITPSATTGTITITATGAATIFEDADVDRQIVAGAARAVITSLVGAAPASVVNADVLVDFANTDPIPSGSWVIRPGTPLAYLDPDKSAKGAQVTVHLEDDAAAAVTGFRAQDVGKYIYILGGLIKLTEFTDSSTMKGEIIRKLRDSTDPTTGLFKKNPVPVPEGAWTMEVPAWTAARGYPRTVAYLSEDRLAFGGTTEQPSTVWASVVGKYLDFGRGTLADESIVATIAGKETNTIQWMLGHSKWFAGTAGNEVLLEGPNGQKVTADEVVNLKPLTNEGGKFRQPVLINNDILFVDYMGEHVLAMRFDDPLQAFKVVDLTILADHISSTGLDHAAYCKEPEPHIFFERVDGQAAILLYYPDESIIGWSRMVTDGVIESIAAGPHPDGDRYQVWMIVKRTINGATKRYVEYLEDKASEHVTQFGTDEGRYAFQTDSALIYSGAAVSTLTGLDHLEGESVSVISDGAYLGDYTVASGAIDISPATTTYAEVGLPYTSTLKTLRPESTQQGETTRHVPKRWVNVGMDVYQTLGLKVNGKVLPGHVVGEDLDARLPLYTGTEVITQYAAKERTGQITITQEQPYPATVLSIFGDLSIGDW